METTTPKIANMTPITGRMVNDNDVIHNIVDADGMVKVALAANTYVHEGKAFNFSFVGSVSTTTYLMGRTGAKPVHLLGYHVTSATQAMTIEFYEAPTVTVDGTAQSVIPRNRIESETPTLAVYLGPTVTADGLLLAKSKIFASGSGANRVGGDDAISIEWLLKPDTDYVFKLTPGGTTEVTADFTWMETEF